MALSLLDPLGASIALIATYQFTRASHTAWPLSFMAICINTVLYWQKGIYGHVGLEFIYLISTVYGWYHWTRNRNRKKIRRQITRMPWFGYALLFLWGPVLILLLAGYLELHFGSNIPRLDATTTLLALTAQFMLCRKWIECWLVWFIVDALVVGMHVYKGIPFHAASHFLYLIFAVLGYLRWKKMFAQQSKTDSTSVDSSGTEIFASH